MVSKEEANDVSLEADQYQWTKRVPWGGGGGDGLKVVDPICISFISKLCKDEKYTHWWCIMKSYIWS